MVKLERLSSTWNYIQAIELIDLVGTDVDRHTMRAVWNTLRDLCQRRVIDFDKAQSDIIDMIVTATDLDIDTKIQIRDQKTPMWVPDRSIDWFCCNEIRDYNP